jgi:hypothetical protein
MKAKYLSANEIAEIASHKLKGHRVYNYKNRVLCRTCEVCLARNAYNYSGELEE